MWPAKSWEALRAKHLPAKAEQLSSFIHMAEMYSDTKRNS